MLHVSISGVWLLMIPPILQPFIVKISVFNWWYIHVASEPHSSFVHYLLVAFLSARRSLCADTRILKQYESDMKEETHSKPRDSSYSHSATMHLTLHHNNLVTIASKHQLPFAEWHLHPLPLLRPWTSDTLSMDIPLFLPRRNSSAHLKGWARKMDLNQIHHNFFIPGFRCFKHF